MRINSTSSRTVKGFWLNIDHQRQYLEGLKDKMGFKEMEDWYHLNWKRMNEEGAGSILKKHGGSPSLMLQSVFSNHSWKKIRFHKRTKMNYWNSKMNRMEILKYIKK